MNVGFQMMQDLATLGALAQPKGMSGAQTPGQAGGNAFSDLMLLVEQTPQQDVQVQPDAQTGTLMDLLTSDEEESSLPSLAAQELAAAMLAPQVIAQVDPQTLKSVDQTQASAPALVAETATAEKLVADSALDVGTTEQQADGANGLKSDLLTADASSPELSISQEMNETQSFAGQEVQAQQVASDADKKASEQAVLQMQDTKLFQNVDGPIEKVGQPPVLDTQSDEFDANLTQQIELLSAEKTGDNKVTIQLNPEHLGRITVHVSQDEHGALQVLLQTASEKTTRLMTEHVGGLVGLLRENQTVPVQVQVQQEQPSQQNTNPDGHQQQQHQQQQRRPQASADFTQQLRLGLIGLDAAAG